VLLNADDAQEAATEGSSEFEEARLASKRKQFQQASDKFAEGIGRRNLSLSLPRPETHESGVSQH
jgi:hypothetical protein